MPKPDPIHLVFKRERDTKNKVRYEEQNVGKDGPVVDKLYISKSPLKKMGNPDVLHVHIEAP